MNNIGINFKFKASDLFYDKIILDFIMDYNIHSNVIQIKFDLSNKYIENIIELIENNFLGEIYVHIRNNDFLNLCDFSEFFSYGGSKNFIVHIDSNFDYNICLDKIKKLKSLKNFEKDITVFLENGDSCNIAMIIDDLNLLFKNNFSKNLKLCLDLSHLFICKNFEEQNEIILSIIENKNILNNIGLFHLHGYDKYRDHLSLRNFGDRLINYEAVRKIISLNNSPIILEVGLKNYLEYVDEIKYFNSIISKDEKF